MSLIKINGNWGEGGGAIVRVALALSTVTQNPFEISDIRKGRKDAGLKNQHLYCVKSLQELCNAEVEGTELGSSYLKYSPNKLVAKNLNIDIQTAGSITLLLQALIPPAIFVNKPVRITIVGGTNVKWSPSYDYFNNVLLPQLQRLAGIQATLLKRGYYPKGNGSVEVNIQPKFRLNDFSSFDKFYEHLKQNVNKINLADQHKLIQIKGISHASKDLQQAKVAERQAESAELMLRKRFSVPVNATIEYQDTMSTGCGITLWAVFSKNKDDIDASNPIRIGSDSLGEQGKRSETVGEEAAKNLIREIESKAAVDGHLADQILPYLALIRGSTIRTSEITNHCKTNIYTIQQFMGEIFRIDEKEKIVSVK